jgi:hypothetical protein
MSAELEQDSLLEQRVVQAGKQNLQETDNASSRRRL